MKYSPPPRQSPVYAVVRLPRKRVLAAFLGVSIIVFVFLNGALGLYQWVAGLPTAAFPLPLFDLDDELSMPTWYAVLLLALCALLLGLISAIKESRQAPFRRRWQVLCGIFLYLSLDESVMLHERLIEPVRGALGVGGVFYFAWVIPVGLAVLLLAVVYLQFLLHLPRQTQRHFTVAAALYVGGALVVEMVTGYILETYGAGVQTGLLVILEETMELSGAAIFLYGLLVYLGSLAEKIVFELPFT